MNTDKWFTARLEPKLETELYRMAAAVRRLSNLIYAMFWIYLALSIGVIVVFCLLTAGGIASIVGTLERLLSVPDDYGIRPPP